MKLFVAALVLWTTSPALAHPGHKGSERMLKLDLAGRDLVRPAHRPGQLSLVH